ncbi:MAG: DUF1641 domain-containing protein [Alicyclobacillus herbarius]|uniref:DUF1641 domain-containing protein n=1 Tax=Alicyclobacillus herbarius TaxID=122960 RepID=UPI000403DF80|nr:DUF1641 domain-containing protein [Alicyclobacillus herbarius]MCL6631201.1 DUF1641 domain-containing protein [Alicyclobacillus herbarius]
MTQATLPETTNSLQSQDEVFELLLKPEVQQSLATLVESLPRIASMVAVLNKVCDLTTGVLTDGEFMGAVDEMIREKTKPLKDKLGGLPSAIQEAKQRAEASNAQIGLFGILRLLKEPVVQKNLRFFVALCEVLAERDAAKTR